MTIKFTEPRSEEVISKTIPKSQNVCPLVAMTESGAYEVQPEFAVPSFRAKLESMTKPPGR